MATFISTFDGRRSAVAADAQYDLSKPPDGWETISGAWTIQRVPGASRNGMALVQAATDNEYKNLRWPRLSEQIFRIDKWSLCRG
jgi:hypothetical protein